MKRLMLVLSVVTVLTGCVVGAREKTSLDLVLEGCETGNTVTLTASSGLFGNSVTASCTWVVKPKDSK